MMRSGRNGAIVRLQGVAGCHNPLSVNYGKNSLITVISQISAEVEMGAFTTSRTSGHQKRALMPGGRRLKRTRQRRESKPSAIMRRFITAFLLCRMKRQRLLSERRGALVNC